MAAIMDATGRRGRALSTAARYSAGVNRFTHEFTLLGALLAVLTTLVVLAVLRYALAWREVAIFAR
jgi:hypothetical protein